MYVSALVPLALFISANALPVNYRRTGFRRSLTTPSLLLTQCAELDLPLPSTAQTSTIATTTSSMTSSVTASVPASAALSSTSGFSSSLSALSSSPSPLTPLPSSTSGSSPSLSALASSPPPSTPLPSSTIGSAEPPASTQNASSSWISGQKYVVAHHMVGNTFPYTETNWASDIALAHASGIDGFALNVGRDDWQPSQVANAYNAASQSGADFKLFLSFDMSSLPCASPDDAATLRKYITTYATHPNQATYNGRVLASSFSGETCTFGQSSPSTGWSSQFTQHPDLTGQNAVAFVPAFFVDPDTFGTFNGVMDGVLNWNSAWPVQLTADFANNILSAVGASLSSIASSITSKVSDTLAAFVNGTTSDTAYINGLNAMPSDGQKRIYLATVSPWFFTHYSPQTFDKNFVYYSDSHLYPTRWESLVATRDQIDIVEIVTWNDYGESHYIGPIEGAQPNSQAWTDGMNHTGWLDMTKYYADAFRTGAYPPVAEDKLYMWSRPHARDANAPDPVGKPSNFQITEDTVWVVAMTTAPATVTLSTSDSDTQTFQVPAGANKLSVPISAGGFMHGSIQRNGQTVVDLKPDGFTFQGSPSTYNYNAFVAFAGSSQS